MNSRTTPVLALLAGGGNLPAALVTAAQARGWPCHIVTFTGQPQPENLPEGTASQTQLPLGSVGRILAHLKGRGVTHVALAGNLSKPSLFSLKPDAKGLALLARAAKTFGSHHDDALLRTITGALEEEGLTVMATSELSPALLVPAGVMSTRQPSGQDHADIQLALKALQATGRLDIGQAAVVMNGTILGLEAVEGTNALIERCAPLRGDAQKDAGWLVKVAKPGQTLHADLPTVGPETVRLLAGLGYRGLAVQAGKTLLIGQDVMSEKINRSKMILFSVQVEWEEGQGA